MQCCPKTSETTLHKKIAYAMFAQRGDIVLQENNPHNVVLNLPGPTLHKTIAFAMMAHSPQSSQMHLG